MSSRRSELPSKNIEHVDIDTHDIAATFPRQSAYRQELADAQKPTVSGGWDGEPTRSRDVDLIASWRCSVIAWCCTCARWPNPQRDVMTVQPLAEPCRRWRDHFELRPKLQGDDG
jgi:hypothetical protein